MDGYRFCHHSPKIAINLLERAASLGIADAHWDLARIYGRTGHARRDLRLAHNHLDSAAKAGIVPAQIALARRLIARQGDLEAWLRAGHWLQAALNDGAAHAEAGALLDRIAGHAMDWPAQTFAAQVRALPAIAKEYHPRLAARLALAAAFSLTMREALFIDVANADHGWCVLVDLRRHFRYKAWRLVRVETDTQRAALRAAVEMSFPPRFDGDNDDMSGTTRARARRLESLLGRLQIDPAIFIQDWRSPS